MIFCFSWMASSFSLSDLMSLSPMSYDSRISVYSVTMALITMASRGITPTTCSGRGVDMGRSETRYALRHRIPSHGMRLLSSMNRRLSSSIPLRVSV